MRGDRVVDPGTASEVGDARDWAVRGYLFLFETVHDEWGPYEIDEYLGENEAIGFAGRWLPTDAPEWLRAALRIGLNDAIWMHR